MLQVAWTRTLESSSSPLLLSYSLVIRKSFWDKPPNICSIITSYYFLFSSRIWMIIISHLDSYNGFLSGFPASIFLPLQFVTNTEFKNTLWKRKSGHGNFCSKFSHEVSFPSDKTKVLKSPTKQLQDLAPPLFLWPHLLLLCHWLLYHSHAGLLGFQYGSIMPVCSHLWNFALAISSPRIFSHQ